MSAKQQHPFHLVELSPWPILTSFSLLSVTLGAVFLMHGHSMVEYFSIFGGGAVIFCSYRWWRDIIREGRIEHHHTEKSKDGIKNRHDPFYTFRSHVFFFSDSSFPFF